jgi:hypothetical protein
MTAEGIAKEAQVASPSRRKIARACLLSVVLCVVLCALAFALTEGWPVKSHQDDPHWSCPGLWDFTNHGVPVKENVIPAGRPGCA